MQNYIQGKTYRLLLSERQNQTFSEAEVRSILLQVLPQLVQLHRQGWVHGGISLDTIVQDQATLQAVLVQGSSQVAGYIAPEHLQTGQYSAAGDIYGLGISMIVLLTGCNPQALQGASRGWSWHDASAASLALNAILDRAIAFDPQQRYADAAAMLAAIPSPLPVEPQRSSAPAAGSFGGLRSSAYTQGPPVISSRSQPPIWLWGIVGIALAGLGGLGIAAYQFLARPTPGQIESALPESPSVESPLPSDRPEPLPSPGPASPTPSSPSPSTPSPTATESPDPPAFDGVPFPQARCGDAIPAEASAYPLDFYPVFIADTESNLQRVTRQFCQDAYRTRRQSTGEPTIQVASFTSQERATRFKDLLVEAFGSGEVGQPRRLDRPPNESSGTEPDG